MQGNLPTPHFTIFFRALSKHFLFHVLCLVVIPLLTRAQLPEECQLDIGTNLAGLADFGTELPFVDVMRNARTWYTKDVDNPDGGFDSGYAEHLSYRSDGYPTHLPQDIPASGYSQRVATIWAITSGWPSGQYTVLWEGTGTFQFIGPYENLEQTGGNRIVFDYPNPFDGALEMTLLTSDIDDPIHNIRVLMPGTEATYLTEPFNPVFLDRALTFQTVRFMDWGQTNNWGQTNEDWNDPTLFDWADRSQMDHYTWAYEKGVPYEMMVKIMNDYDLDGWVCVPHRASDDYLTEMANYFRDHLEPERHLTVEYSNEIWNWIFGQTQWLNEYGCIQQDLPWPDGIVPYVQNCLDHFTTSFDGQMDRITRVVGAFTGWPDITQTIVTNLTPGSFDAIALTFYFGIPEDGDLVLDDLGANATTDDIAFYARQGMVENLMYINMHKTDIADPLGVPLTFYEGGQHLTPTPFGVEPTYAQALLDIQRDTAMFNLYNEWFDDLRTLQTDDQPLQLMHFSFVSNRSAQYGSWGMLETMDQDTSLIPAPKYSAVLDNMATEDCEAPLSVEWTDYGIDQEGCEATIFWKTLSETDNSHFVVERSRDGLNFKPIATLTGAGYSNTTQHYRYVDNTLGSGTYYYQILQIDFDGKVENLGQRVVELDCGDTSFPIKIIPNPAQNDLLVYPSRSLQAFTLVVFNSAGKIVLQESARRLAAGAPLALDIADWPDGVYYLQLHDGEYGSTAVKFVKHTGE